MLLLLATLACSGTGEVKLDDGTTDTNVESDDTAPVGDDTEAPIDTDPGGSGSELADAVTVEGIKDHLAELQRIADENGGNRAVYSSGYDASVDYVVRVLEASGYEARTETFAIEGSNYSADLAQTFPSEVEYSGRDFGVLSGSGTGSATASVQSVDLMLPPGDSENSSTSGCESSDFSGFRAGNIALVQRGTCTFQEKAENAVAAGAKAILIFNEGQAGRTDVVSGYMETNSSIPVLGMSFDLGEELAGIAASDTGLKMSVEVTEAAASSTNVIAWRQGKSDSFIAVGAHLDSVTAGPGINDNGSGSATILEIAEQVAALDMETERSLQFMWWGAEEIGLEGSFAYLADRAQNNPSELEAMDAYLNFDMVGSENGLPFIYDGDGSGSSVDYQWDGATPAGSDFVESVFEDWYGDEPTERVGLAVPSDSYGFALYDIPTGGLFSGANNRKSNGEQDLYGGSSGEAYDECYHQSCDTEDMILDTLLGHLSQGAAYATETLVNHPDEIKPANIAPVQPRELPELEHGHGCGGELHHSER